MTRRARIALTAGMLALTLVVMGAGFPAKRVPPKQWTGGLCTKLDTWRSVAVDGARQLSTELSGAQVSLSEARTALTRGTLPSVAWRTAISSTRRRTSPCPGRTTSRCARSRRRTSPR